MERSNWPKVWKHFTRDDDDSDRSNCIHFLKKEITCKGASTSSLFRHLKSKHNLRLESKDQQPCTTKRAKFQQKSILP